MPPPPPTKKKNYRKRGKLREIYGIRENCGENEANTKFFCTDVAAPTQQAVDPFKRPIITIFCLLSNLQ